MALVTDPNPPAYNGYTFPSNVRTVQFDQTPKYDDAERALLYIQYRIGLEFDVLSTSGNDIDSTVAGLRRTLTAMAGTFTYANRGFGTDFTVGQGLAIQDLKGGPKPVGFSFKPQGQNKGATITWTVELCIPSQCSSIDYDAPITIQYRHKVSLDLGGFATVNMSGFIEIPKLAQSYNTRNIDNYLERIMPNNIPEYKRTRRDFQYSLDRTRCDFEVIDEQFKTEAMLPPYIIAASASHELESDLDRGLLQWDGTISGRYTVAYGIAMDQSWVAFKDLLKTRLTVINANLDTGGFNGEAKLEEQKPNEKAKVIITRLKMSEPDIYNSRTASFSASYRQISTLKTLIAADELKTGMFKFSDTGLNAYINWEGSLFGNALNQRGLSNFNNPAGNDVILQVCTSTSGNTPNPTSNINDNISRNGLGDVSDLQPEKDPDRSWFLWEPEIDVCEDNHYVVNSMLTDETWRPYELSPGDLTNLGYQPDTKPSDPTDAVQYRAPSTLYVYLSGKAMRAWYQIPRVKVVSWGGLQFKEISSRANGCFWRSKNIGSMGIGIPIYYAEWRFLYAIEARPTAPIKPPTALSEQN